MSSEEEHRAREQARNLARCQNGQHMYTDEHGHRWPHCRYCGFSQYSEPKHVIDAWYEAGREKD